MLLYGLVNLHTLRRRVTRNVRVHITVTFIQIGDLLCQRTIAQFATNARLLEATEWKLRMNLVTTVDRLCQL